MDAIPSSIIFDTKHVISMLALVCARYTTKQVQWLTGLKLGLLLNFGATLMKDGIVRCVNALED